MHVNNLGENFYEIQGFDLRLLRIPLIDGFQMYQLLVYVPTEKLNANNNSNHKKISFIKTEILPYMYV